MRHLDVAREGVAILVRTTFIESVGRNCNLFNSVPSSRFVQFTERVPMVKVNGRRGPFWSCHEKNSDGSWCSYRPKER